MEEVELILEATNEQMSGALEHLQRELAKITTGKASPAMLESIKVEYYGTSTLLSQIANLGTADARTITIQPWERTMLAPIERAIFEANLGFTPQNDGQLIRIFVPPLTQERRIDFVKRAKGFGEEAKVSIRNARREAMEGIKKAVKDGYPEDIAKRNEQEVQDLTNTFTTKVDKVLEVKEKEIMTV